MRRASVLVFCTVFMGAMQAVLGLLEAPLGVRVGAAVIVAAVAAASELDKLHTRRREQRDADQQAQQARETAEADWLRKTQGLNDEAVEVHREIAEILSAEEPPSQAVWAAALEEAVAAADSDTVGRIGFQAHVHGEVDIATEAWARIATLDEPAAEWHQRAAVSATDAARPGWRYHGGSVYSS